ncbi:MAG: YqiJ family protein [Hyphomonas sp.]|nr:YqiJ family protein [Hyphomonas sp.]
MMEFLHPAVAPFTIALIIMGMLALLEIIGLMFGMGLSGLLDSALPDVDADADADADMPDADGGAGVLGAVTSWLSIGRVPLLVLIVAFLTGFGLAGLIGQNTLKGVLGFYLPVPLAVAGALIVALPVTRHLGLALARLVPKEETDAVSSDSFVGRTAVIIRGEAKQGLPAEAKLRDKAGTVQYVLVEPDETGTSFAQGSEVILVERKGPVFRAIMNTLPALSDRAG